MDPSQPLDERAHFARIRELFEQALLIEDLPARTRFLKRLCGSDEGLRSEIEALLTSHEKSSLLEPPDHGFAARFAVPPIEPSLFGSQAGAYRIESLIGSGGMSQVYSARRTDGRFDLEVAVKVIKRGMETEEILRRFRIEQQALARLDHPSISRLFDAGSLPDGRPFFVMEKIEGEPVTRACDRQRRSLRQRLVLFRKVCAAIDYAHRQLVLHRDLKPSNILVTPDGQAKVLDFGIAKFLARNEGHPDDSTAQGSDRPMTPAYASPEQLQGEPVTTATDVYALGVLLHELLTGRRPFAHLPPRGEDHVAAICGELPPKPSRIVGLTQDCSLTWGGPTTRVLPEAVARARSTSPGALSRRLRGDLDNIVLTALQPDLARRYTSVDRLSEDLDRFLRGRPVSARPDTLSYRSGKFLKRNRLAVAVGGLFITSLVVTTGIALAGFNRARRERDATKQSETRRLDSLNFVESMFDAHRYGSPPDRTTLKEMLLSSVLQLRDRDRSTDDLSIALIELTIGKLCARNGLPQEADELLRRSFEIRERITGPESRETAEVSLNLAISLRAQGRFEEALPYAERAVVVYRRSPGERPALFVSSLAEAGTLLSLQGKYAEACPLLEEASRCGRALHPPNPRVLRTALNSFALAKLGIGDLEAGERLLGEAQEISEKDNAGFSILLNNLAKFHFVRNRLDEAESLVSRALTILNRSYPYLHREIGMSLNNLGLIAFERGDFEKAEVSIREGLAARKRALGSSHPIVADTFLNLSEVLDARGDLEGSANALRKSIAIYRRSLPPGHPRLLRLQDKLAARGE